MKGQKKITMQDVAREAEVSSATVSRVLAGVKGATSEATAERVLHTARRLGYVVNSVAASLRKEKTFSVGLILADISNPFFGGLARGVENTLKSEGFSVLLANTDNDVTEEKRLLRLMMEKQVDAVIMSSSASENDHILDAVARGMHIVLVDTELKDVPVDTVVVDNQQAAKKAVDYLINLGHRNIAIITGKQQASFDQERLEGYREALNAKGIAICEDLIFSSDSTYLGGRHAIKTLIRQDPSITAFFATNNLMTIGALSEILAQGFTIPQDFSLIGFDDMEWYPIFKPAITAISQPIYQLGIIAAQRLLNALLSEQPLSPERIVLNTEFIIRDSASPPSLSIPSVTEKK
ncbi:MULTISPECIES: substrate-binding domain-containing protein [Brenneria]|uniref:LacI family transcriptional regulator n=1 Tax=Brenneria nigrifluens DSM 30175 = ATCC 13028 TaxID=1121120 RepID=A0A2U1UWW5_9GAMM|nr:MULTISPECIES: substrate-binding domain-containing protein [Brenneria]EHD22566.1 transcriptional regulator, LacI family [Brenneria sp. EniD312]PWC26061.1 LacI family transcriptional regulator [Brenneria nigrifluens DSM 30175 = ATCC 13028]QCR05555.1 LacI family transcriptional regulator [Brenneria nigrifluens DSM 30175 = ATCC 13028]